MYPFLRYATTIAHAAFQAKKGKTLAVDAVGEISLRCHLSDIDNF